MCVGPRQQAAGGTNVGNARYYWIDANGVAGTANAITLTTGQSLTALQDGDRFGFRCEVEHRRGQRVDHRGQQRRRSTLRVLTIRR